MKMLRILFTLFNLFNLFNLVYSFNIVNKVIPYNDKRIGKNIIFLENLQNDRNFLFLAPKINKYNSYPLYQSFINELNKHGNVIVGNEITANDIKNYKNITLISHSIAARESIELSMLDNIKNLVLIDPINIGDYENSNKINYNNIIDINKINSETDNYSISNLDNFIYLDLKLSNKWGIMPFVVPIGIFKLKLKDINIDNKINVINKDINLYGHFDIVDENWSNLFHNSFSKGSENRDPERLKALNNWLIITIKNLTK